MRDRPSSRGRCPARVLRALALGLALTLASALAACSRTPAFKGARLDPPREELDFALTDQFGRPVRLSELRGRVVALTFIYTACRDVCPLVTAKIRQVTDLLGDRRAGVAFLAVTVDPRRDTVREARAYSQRFGLDDRWRFLTGSERELAPVWRYYWVGDVRREVVEGGRESANDIEHTSPVHLIDRRGRIRVVHGSDFVPADLTSDIGVLLRR